MKTHELSQIQKMLQDQGYIDDGGIAMSIFLAMKLENPCWLKVLPEWEKPKLPK